MSSEASAVEIRRYDPSMAARWNDFCRTARNATFLFDRRFMDYHADRFEDCSLVACNSGGRIVGLLPACVDMEGGRLRSHAGLTYGGWIMAGRHFTPMTMLDIWDASLGWMRSAGIDTLIYKALPTIYATRPSADDRYALLRSGARLIESQLSMAVDLASPGPFNESTRQSVKGALAAGVSVRFEPMESLPEFWAMLECCLAERHGGVRPVHTLAEITLLASRFPRNIRLGVARSPRGEILAGTLLFDTGRVVHTQYIATTAEGRRIKALTPLIAMIIDSATADGRAYFDFGISPEPAAPRGVNEGLLLQKSGFGASAVAHDIYELKL